MQRMPSGRGTGTWRFTGAPVSPSGLRNLGPEGMGRREGSPVSAGQVGNNFSQNSPLLSFKIILALHVFQNILTESDAKYM